MPTTSHSPVDRTGATPVRRRRFGLGAAAVAVVGGLVGVLPAAPASAVTCSSIDVVFARGTGERQGLGSVGGPFTSDVTSDLSGRSVSSYAVVYAAATNQSSAGAGSTDLVNHVQSVAASCPGTRFVLGGYSQGATVVDKALGLQTTTGGAGTVLPSALAPKVAAIVVFGNPLGLQRQTIETASATYGARAKSYCNTGDPVCGNGNNFAAHLQYVSNGSAAAGAQFAATKVTAG
ncbi:cutinase family protein [Lapillicoccus sp.]|uniref:cutinase family protein n=1 Tax=Lapillicoccus sp. TaxID=1909287 RepID=UPI0025E542EC|nr:cutinase family protein [Lapillicoccus sp.]